MRQKAALQASRDAAVHDAGDMLRKSRQQSELSGTPGRRVKALQGQYAVWRIALSLPARSKNKKGFGDDL